MFVTELAGRGSASKSARGKLPALSSHECAPPPKLSNAALQFDANPMPKADGSWRSQKVIKQRSPRLLSTGGAPSAVDALAHRSDDDIMQALLESELSPATFVDYLQQVAVASPSRLVPWMTTLASLASKVGMLLESTRFLCADLQLARALMHITAAAKALTGSKRAIAFLVHAESDALLRVGDRGEVLTASPESVSRGTSFAAHCARSAKPLVIGLPGSSERAALHFNVDSGTGCRPEACLCVPCLDHVGNVLAVMQVRAPRSDSVQAASRLEPRTPDRSLCRRRPALRRRRYARLASAHSRGLAP